MKYLVAALLLSASPVLALDLESMSEAEKAAFGEAVREYLMTHPEVLVESINELEKRNVADAAQNDKQLVAANTKAIFEDGHSWVGGNPDGDLTIVEFIDYRCGVCRRFNDEVKDVVKNDGNIRFILKEFPILGQESDISSRFAVAVKQIAGDEAYIQAHDELIALRGPATVEAMQEIAKKIGVNGEEAVNLMNTESVSAVLRENRQLAERMGIQGTPTFVIGEELLRGVPGEGLTAAVKDIRTALKDKG